MDEGYIELVLSTVEQIPAGQVASYGDIAELVGIGGPRLVGRVMSLHGSGVPWWRVVRADGRPVRGLEEQALELLRRDGTPLHDDRVDMRAARMRPSADPDTRPAPGAVPTNG
jgi:alkylated DNA nucleotide flippase Atl1